MKTDVAVIGTGLSALAAARTIQQSGRQVVLVWQGALNRNFLLPTATGTPKPCCLAPASMTAGDVSRPEPIVFCGFTGYQDFAPELAASNLKRQWGAADVSAIRVTAPGYGPDR